MPYYLFNMPLLVRRVPPVEVPDSEAENGVPRHPADPQGRRPLLQGEKCRLHKT